MFGNDPRNYSITTVEFKGEDGQLKSLVTQNVEVTPSGIQKIPGAVIENLG